MKAIYDGVYAKFNVTTNNLFISVNGRMFAGMVSANCEFPYIEYNINIRRERTFEKKYDYYDVQFNIFSNKENQVEAQTIYGYLDTVYGDDALSLSISGFTFIRMDLETVTEPMLTDASITGLPQVWQISVNYNLIVLKA